MFNFHPAIIWSGAGVLIVFLILIVWLVLKASESKDRKKRDRPTKPSLRDDPDRERRQDMHRRLEELASRPRPRAYESKPGYESEPGYVEAPGYQTAGMAMSVMAERMKQKIEQQKKPQVKLSQKQREVLAMAEAQKRRASLERSRLGRGFIDKVNTYEFIEAEVDVLEVHDLEGMDGNKKVTTVILPNGKKTVLQGDHGPVGKQKIKIQRFMLEED